MQTGRDNHCFIGRVWRERMERSAVARRQAMEADDLSGIAQSRRQVWQRQRQRQRRQSEKRQVFRPGPALIAIAQGLATGFGARLGCG